MRSAQTKTEVKSANQYALVTPGQPRHIIVEIHNDTLTFREQGQKKRYTLPLADAMREAIIKTPSHG